VTSWQQVGRGAAALGVAGGVAAVGAALGLAAERSAVGRTLRARDPYAEEPFGTLRGTPFVVVASDGVELHAEVDESRPHRSSDVTVVFCHGYALNLDVWHFQRRDLAGAARLVLWDQRSHGRSGRSEPDRVSIDQLGRDLEHVVDALVPRGPIVLVGHSMGGMTVLALARRRPDWFGERVVGAALLSTSAGGLSEVTLGVPGAAGRTAHKLAPSVVSSLARQPSLVERTRRVGSDLGFVLTKRYSFGPNVPPSLVELTADLNAATPIEVVAHFLPIFDVHDEIAGLGAFGRVETFVLGAQLDLLTPVEHARHLVRHIPTAEYLEIEDSGHMAFLEHHEQVTPRLRGLVERVAPRAATG
jgi:pimeloyl-ACP methyl ester carboxylesterase